MKQAIFLSLCILLAGVAGCSESKPPLEPTQIVDGKSIIMPPEFYVLPKAKSGSAASSAETDY